MKLKFYTLTEESDAGTRTNGFGTEHERDTYRALLVGQLWADHYDDLPPMVDVDEAYEQMSSCAGFFDRISTDESEITINEPTGPKVNKVCRHCGSDDVVKDAWAEWSVAEQQWVLRDVFDYGFCNVCEGDTKIEEQPL